MKLKDFMAAMQAIETDRKLSKEVVVDALQEALAKAFRKHIEIPDALVRVDVNEKSGDIKVYQQRLIVENVEDDELEISLEDAKRVNQELELGGVVEEYSRSGTRSCYSGKECHEAENPRGRKACGV